MEETKKTNSENSENNKFKSNYRNKKPGGFRFQKRKKFCKFCAQGIQMVDYKDVETLSKYINYNGKISPKKINGNCTVHQRRVANAIKRARIVALLPFVGE